MHLAMQIFSESSSLGPGFVTHLAKHLVVITCKGNSRDGSACKGSVEAHRRKFLKRWAGGAHLHHFLDVLCRHLTLNLHLGLVDV